MSEKEQVHEVERILDAGASRHEIHVPSARSPVSGRANGDHRVRAELALWLCVCYDDGPPLTWLIVGDDDRLLWCSIPQGLDVDDVVDADLVAGSHTSSNDVLEFLSGVRSLPGDYFGDDDVAHRVARRLLATSR